MAAVLEAVFALIIIVSPLAFGSVHAWAWASCSAMLFLGVLVCPQCLSTLNLFSPSFKRAFVALFVLVLLHMLFFTRNLYTSAFELLRWTSLFCLFLLGHLLTVKSIIRLLGIIAALGALFSVYGLFEVWSGHEHVLWQAKEVYLKFVTGTYINRNHFAGFLEMAISLQAGFYLRSIMNKQFSKSLLWGIALFVSLMALIKTGSRSGMVSLGLSLLLGFVFIGRVSVKKSILFIIVILVLAGGAVYMGAETISARFIENPRDWVTWEGRFTGWKDTVYMIQSNFLAGVGLGNFEWFFPRFQSPALIMGWAHAHNDYLELMAELGVPLFFLLFLFGTSFLSSLAVKSRKQMDTPEYSLLWGSWIGVLSLAIHGLTDFNWAIPGNALLYIFLITAISRLSASEVPEEGAYDA